MRFYIPTSSLNFDNILSSESIAPAVFYQKRTYGYDSFEIAGGINYRNKIVLLSKMPKFSIRDTERENFPMVIEVDIPETLFDSYEINKLSREYDFELYTAAQTIYLNFSICKIFFFDEKSLSSIKLKLSDSLTIKMGKFYHIDIAPKENQFEWKNIYLPEKGNSQIQSNISELIVKDDNINRVKGFLFAYTGGLLQSIPNDVAKIRKIYREIYNIISSILNDSNSIPYSFIEKLNVLKSEFEELDPDRKKLREVYNSLFPDTVEVKRIIEYFKESCMKNLICEKEQIKPYSFPKFSNNLSKEEWEKTNEDIQHLEKQTNPIDALQVKEKIWKIKTSGQKLVKFDMDVLDEKQKDLYRMLLNDCFLCKDGISIDNVRIDKRKLGDDITRKIKSRFDENEWENSDVKKYFLALRNNIANATSFDVASTNNIIEQSIAAFLLKGESLGGLREYLENNGIGDLSFAYGFWGATIGFANMPKTLTNDLFLSDDLNYISEIYKYIFKQVHGIELEGKLEIKEEEFVTDSLKINEKIKIEGEGEKETSTKQQANEIEYREKLKQVPMINSQIIDSVIDVLKNNYFMVNSKLFDTISKIDKLGKRTNAFKKIKECLQPESQQTGDSINVLSLFSNDIKPDKEFYKDTNVLSFLNIPKNKQEEVKKEIKWIQDVHKENGYKIKSGEWKPLKDHSNKEVIKHLENNAKKRIELDLLNQIVAKLKELYLNNE
ncbi:MAG: hypothetical protein LBL13_09060 [Bacteroidales bacterium]|jgi:hypothetical protein|nr:hypothetical protein [Bacteroidales bacterium]